MLNLPRRLWQREVYVPYGIYMGTKGKDILQTMTTIITKWHCLAALSQTLRDTEQNAKKRWKLRV